MGGCLNSRRKGRAGPPRQPMAGVKNSPHPPTPPPPPGDVQVGRLFYCLQLTCPKRIDPLPFWCSLIWQRLFALAPRGDRSPGISGSLGWATETSGALKSGADSSASVGAVGACPLFPLLAGHVPIPVARPKRPRLLFGVADFKAKHPSCTAIW